MKCWGNSAGSSVHKILSSSHASLTFADLQLRSFGLQNAVQHMREAFVSSNQAIDGRAYPLVLPPTSLEVKHLDN